jgi:N-acetylglucosamine-6-phosphate deacetylase
MTASALALVPDRLFDGERFRDGRAVVIDAGRITDVPPVAALDPGLPRRAVPGLLAPGFIDVQVNGGGGVLFNDDPSPAAIRTIGAAHRRFGTTGFLPTLITDRRPRMAQAIAAVRDGLAAGLPGLLGIHLEGPFLSPARPGVHDPALIRAPDSEDLALLASLGAGRTLVTLAPERVAPAAIARLAAAGVRVAAGHSAATLAQLKDALDHGLAGYTHLFNAMPPLAAREPGPAGAALADRRGHVGIIADLHHVCAAALRLAVAAAGPERIVLVTDAMPTVGWSGDGFRLLGKEVRRAGGRLTTADGTLAGSDLDMATAVRNMVRAVGVPLGPALAMASLNPATFLGLDHELGRIAPGWRADLVALDAGLAATESWIAGTAACG